MLYVLVVHSFLLLSLHFMSIPQSSTSSSINEHIRFFQLLVAIHFSHSSLFVDSFSFFAGRCTAVNFWSFAFLTSVQLEPAQWAAHLCTKQCNSPRVPGTQDLEDVLLLYLVVDAADSRCLHWALIQSMCAQGLAPGMRGLFTARQGDSTSKCPRRTRQK